VPARVTLDSGSTTNFMSRNYAEEVGLCLKELPGIDVQAAAGTATCTFGVRKVNVKICRYREKLDFIIIDTNLFDILLGMPWLVRKNAYLDCAGRIAMITHEGEQMRLQCSSDVSSGAPALKSVSALKDTLHSKRKPKYNHFMCWVAVADNDDRFEIHTSDGKNGTRKMETGNSETGTGKKETGNWNWKG
jgi:hypothetical protein